MNDLPACRHGVPYAEECKDCELDAIRERADARYAERMGRWADAVWEQIGDE